MKKNTLTLLLSLSFAFLNSCDENLVNSNVGGSNYIPLHVGSLWNYQYKIDWAEQDYTIKVIDKEDGDFYKIEYTTIYTYKPTNDVTTNQSIGYKRKTKDGILIYNSNKTKSWYELKRPYEVGNSWNYEYKDSSFIHYEIVDVNKTHSTPAGTFTGCLRVKVWFNENISNPEYFTYAKNVGMISHEAPFILYYQLQKYIIPYYMP